MGAPRVSSSLLLDDLYQAGDERFLDEVLTSTAVQQLKALVPLWYANERPFARRALLRYIDDGCDRPHHRPVVKQLFKLAEKQGDDEVMGHFLVAFDRLIARPPPLLLRRRSRRGGKASSTGATPQIKPPGRLWPSEKKAPHFSIVTRGYLRRRATRYFRLIGRTDPERYGRAIRAALSLYEDPHLSTAEQLLDAWGLIHVLYHGSTLLARRPRGVELEPKATIDQLAPAPMIPEAWEDVFDDVLALASKAPSRTVRGFALQLLRRDYDAALRRLTIDQVRALLASPHEDLQLLGAECLLSAAGIESLSIEAWLSLLQLENIDVLAAISEAVQRYVSPARLTLTECVELACAPAAPVAELGLRWARQKQVKTETELETVLRLVRAGAPRVRQEAARWLFEVLTSSPHARSTHVRDLIDAGYADVREQGLALLGADPRFRDDTSLWTALAETPYDDVRTFLLGHLTVRRAAFSPETLRHVWATTLLNVHRGAREKRAALKLLSDRIVARPEEAESLLPLLGVTLRSVRPSERRAALAAVARTAFRAPALRAAIHRQLPELRLFSEELSS
ncbi:hypothetical protein [Chondromyces crocatus]|uniref:Uncharacterized protein n=1 Tax=Chondromyces crocatus TaxID=52 RepID=A0A0K1ETL2_CHOCO|nr:hypothetical protein [Chondromyces crocatus]AKT43992.1 uncharacterized protein CMC5_082300 [Chondromyces crocatus]